MVFASRSRMPDATHTCIPPRLSACERNHCSMYGHRAASASRYTTASFGTAMPESSQSSICQARYEADSAGQSTHCRLHTNTPASLEASTRCMPERCTCRQMHSARTTSDSLSRHTGQSPAQPCSTIADSDVSNPCSLMAFAAADASASSAKHMHHRK